MQRVSDSHPRSKVEPPSLDARPKAEARIIEDLVSEARKGRIRIPAFQRGLKWDADDAGLLFDSIYRGYPIGTLLFWQTRAEAEVVRFGPVTVDANARSDAWWVVDGQQRLTSLVRVLLGTVSDEFSLWFDLDGEAFVHQTATKKEPARYLPLTDVLDTEQLHQWVATNDLSVSRRKTAFRLNKRVREYSVPAYIVETDDEDVLRAIFKRTNDSGKRLKASDVFDALHGARSAEEPANFKGVARSLDDLQFGSVEEHILHRALLAIHGRDPIDAEAPSSFPNAPKAYARTSRAMRAAIVFLVSRAGIPHYNLLPYERPLVTLAKFFDVHPEPSARSRELLTRWLWRGAWAGLHSADAASTRDAVKAIQHDEDDTVQALLGTLGTQVRPPIAPLGRYNFRHARTKLEILALLSLRPRHLVTGTPLQATSLAAPKMVLHVVVGDTLASRILHPPIQKVRIALARADGTTRASHAVSENAHELLMNREDAAFEKRRSADVRDLVERFLESRSKFGVDNDRPPLNALRVSDED